MMAFEATIEELEKTFRATYSASPDAGAAGEPVSESAAFDSLIGATEWIETKAAGRRIDWI